MHQVTPETKQKMANAISNASHAAITAGIM
jgi:hypothetical protein